MSDPIARLRGLLERASNPALWGKSPNIMLDMRRPWDDNEALAIAAVNSLPALLEVAEAARRLDELVPGFLQDGMIINATALDETHKAMRAALRGLDDGEAGNNG